MINANPRDLAPPQRPAPCWPHSLQKWLRSAATMGPCLLCNMRATKGTAAPLHPLFQCGHAHCRALVHHPPGQRQHYVLDEQVAISTEHAPSERTGIHLCFSQRDFHAWHERRKSTFRGKKMAAPHLAHLQRDFSCSLERH